MLYNKVPNVLIGDGSALPTAGSTVSTSTVAAGDLAVVGHDSVILGAGKTVADYPVIKLVQGSSRTDWPLIYSMDIPLKSVTKYEAHAYEGATIYTKAIGYNRKAAAGSIEVNNSTLYQFTVRIDSDKNIYGSRLNKRTFTFTSSASATQSNIADKIVSLVNADPNIKRYLTAVKVGDGTGAYGVTGASLFGVEFTAKEVAQDFVTNYLEERPYFSIELDSAFGFGATTTEALLTGLSKGTGTYNQVYPMEKWAYTASATPVITVWPFSEQTFYTSSSLIASSAITPTVTGTTGEDKVTFSASVSGILQAGDKITISGNTYTIKYFISTTVAILTSVLLTSPSGTAVTKNLLYGIISIEFQNPTNHLGAGVVADNKQQVVIAVPQINAGGAYNSLSSQATGLFAVLNSLLGSVGFAAQSF